MIRRSKMMGAVLAILAGGVLSACATSTTPPATQTVAAEEKKELIVDQATITGSRIPRKTTERLIRGADAKELERDRPPNPGPQQN